MLKKVQELIKEQYDNLVEDPSQQMIDQMLEMDH